MVENKNDDDSISQFIPQLVKDEEKSDVACFEGNSDILAMCWTPWEDEQNMISASQSMSKEQVDSKQESKLPIRFSASMISIQSIDETDSATNSENSLISEEIKPKSKSSSYIEESSLDTRTFNAGSLYIPPESS